MIQRIEHDVVEKATGKIVGVIESDWDGIPGEYLLDGIPAGGVLISRNVFGAVPLSVVAVFDGSATAKDWSESQRFQLVPRPHSTIVG